MRRKAVGLRVKLWNNNAMLGKEQCNQVMKNIETMKISVINSQHSVDASVLVMIGRNTEKSMFSGVLARNTKHDIADKFGAGKDTVKKFEKKRDIGVLLQ